MQEAEEDRVSAWQHGLVSDGTLEWGKRCLQLAQYAVDHGDAHIGYRDNEDSDLVRWARKQRYAYKQKTLPADRCLTSIGCQTYLLSRVHACRLQQNASCSARIAMVVFIGFMQVLASKQIWCSCLLPTHSANV